MRNEFDREAGGSRVGLVAEFWAFLRFRKKWWLFPILAILLLLGVLMIFSASGAAPFIYALF